MHNPAKAPLWLELYLEHGERGVHERVEIFARTFAVDVGVEHLGAGARVVVTNAVTELATEQYHSQQAETVRHSVLETHNGNQLTNVGLIA